MLLTTYKCYTCKLIIQAEDLEPAGDEEVCPVCHAGDNLRVMCEQDCRCTCPREITPTVKWCPVCEEPVCPGCGSHDVVQISRVTGYLQEVSGWNAGKQQELKDRKRYTIGPEGLIS